MAVRKRAHHTDVELEHLRSERTKHFRTPDGKHKVLATIRPMHWHDGQKFIDIDAEPVSPDGGATWTTTSTPYRVSWNISTLTLLYESKNGGSVSVRLASLDGNPPPTASPAVASGHRVSCQVGPLLELQLRLRAQGVEIVKILHGPAAPKSLTWEVVEEVGGHHLNLMSTSGRDNFQLLVKRIGEFADRRRIELEHSRTADDLAAHPGKVTYRVTETLTGRTRLVDPVKRARTWVDQIVYPVLIDVTVTETPAADNDDGNDLGTGYWYGYQGAGSRISGGSLRHPGFRFTTVAIPQAQTLDSATLTLEVLDTTGAATGELFGNNIDDAPAWAASVNTPSSMSLTAAHTTLDVGTTGQKVLNILTQVQAIVNRAGWASNNAMAFGVNGTITGTGDAHIADSFDASPADDPLLTIVYTAAGGASSLLLLTPDLVGGMDAWRGFQSG